MGQTPGTPADPPGSRPTGLKARAHPLPPWRARCALPTRTPIGAHRAPADHRCTCTHTSETHPGPRACSHTPPSVQRLLPAAPPPVELNSGMQAPHRQWSGGWTNPRKQPAGSDQRSAGVGLKAEARAGTPGLRPTPPRPAASAHLATDAWFPVGRKDRDCCACELEPRCGANPRGGGCGARAGE